MKNFASLVSMVALVGLAGAGCDYVDWQDSLEAEDIFTGDTGESESGKGAVAPAPVKMELPDTKKERRAQDERRVIEKAPPAKQSTTDRAAFLTCESQCVDELDDRLYGCWELSGDFEGDLLQDASDVCWDKEERGEEVCADYCETGKTGTCSLSKIHQRTATGTAWT